MMNVKKVWRTPNFLKKQFDRMQKEKGENILSFSKDEDLKLVECIS